VRYVVMSLLALTVLTGCDTRTASTPTERTTTEDVIETALSGDQLVRLTGTVVAGDSPDCRLLDAGGIRYVLIGGDENLIDIDATVTVTGNANPDTPTLCTGGTPLVVTEIVPTE